MSIAKRSILVLGASGLVARNRYRVFGKYDVCHMGGEELRGRVLE